MTPMDYVRSDLYRYAADTSWPCLLRQLLFNHSFRFTFWLRLRRSRLLPVRLLATLMHRHLREKYGVRIQASCEIGPGLYIGHPIGIVINPTARIGRNCNLGQFTTIGSNLGQAAEIGDNVYVGPHVCIVEHVRIGNGATIGAGSVVVKDVPEGATVGGNPARVISHKTPGRFVANPWPPHPPAH